MDQSKMLNKKKNKAIDKGKSISLSKRSGRRNLVIDKTTIK